MGLLQCCNMVSQSLSVRFSFVDLVFADLANVFGQSLSMGGFGFRVYMLRTLWVFLEPLEMVEGS